MFSLTTTIPCSARRPLARLGPSLRRVSCARTGSQRSSRRNCGSFSSSTGAHALSSTLACHTSREYSLGSVAPRIFLRCKAVANCGLAASRKYAFARSIKSAPRGTSNQFRLSSRGSATVARQHHQPKFSSWSLIQASLGRFFHAISIRQKTDCSPKAPHQMG